MSKFLQNKRDKVLKSLIPQIEKDGWNLKALSNSDIEGSEFRALFPNGMNDLSQHFTDYINRHMIEKLKTINPEDLRIRDRIKTACMIRFELLAPYKDIVRKNAQYEASRFNKISPSKRIWSVADLIWTWAGDTSTDYNYYTKRLLLSGVITTTALFWLNIEDNSLNKTEEFLDRRIENVMQLNRLKFKYKKNNNT